jgi:HEAT repeat protein
MRPLCLILIIAAGCQRAPNSPTAASGPKSPAGWEVRYNAALALARRGSLHVKDAEVWDSLVEMLDEDQQLRNFRTKHEDGRETPDETGARTTVISALQAVQALHRKDPIIDLAGLKEPIDKLTRSPNATVSVQARQALLALYPSS